MCLLLCIHCIKNNGVNNLEYTTGFANWKDSSTRLPVHEATACCKTSVLKTVTLPATTCEFGELLFAAHAQNRLEWRQCFLKLLSSVKSKSAASSW